MAKKTQFIKNNSLNDLIQKFSKHDVIAEMEKEYSKMESKTLSISLIDDNKFIDSVAMGQPLVDRFASTIEERGIWNPLIVRPCGAHFELILGRKRFFGAKKIGLAEVPVVAIDVGDEETLLMLLADCRDQREPNIVEMANIYKELANRFDYSQLTLAKISHFSRSQVTNIMRILSLPKNIVDQIATGNLTYGHGRAIATLSNDQIQEIVELIHREKLSVRQTEELARQYTEKPIEKIEISDSDKMKKTTGAKAVTIKNNTITMVFKNEKDLKNFIKTHLN
ncbi:MAG: ParB/RepB/Spo0J family partition protein [Bacilli bacterium]|nr:ParB/RepB/Spo0J family partition protein [Bacilli bacterium]